ncbi:MAG: efflux RND transporter permease subunit [Rhodomicrobium sp.]
MNLSAPFIARPIATVLLMVGLFAGGLVSYRLLPVASLPNVNYPTLQVTAQLPGASPQTVAFSVTTPLETQFGEIPGLTQMTSSSALGFVNITLQFDLSRTVDSAEADTLSAINAASAQLPPRMPYPPTIRKVNPAAAPILVLALSSDTLPITTVDAYAETIFLQKISQVQGVGLVGIGGQQQPAVRVQVDPVALANRQIGLEDVRTVLSQQNVDLPKGTLNSPRVTYTLNTNDQLIEPEPYNNMVLAYRNGGPVHVRDVGRAITGPVNDLLAGWANKQPAIILAVQGEPGANVIDTVDRVKAMLPVLEASIPSAIKVQVLSDRTLTIRASVADVQTTLMITIGLVIMVILLFLRNLWATIIPGITVPLSIIGTFAVLYELGYSLDNLSLMALTIAVGFAVDDAVVVIENIYRHLEEGATPYQAALKGAGEIGFTIVSITLSLIAVFIPLFLMSGYVGMLFREFAVAVSVALVLSLLISLTLTPMLSARLLRPEGNEHGFLYNLLERGFNGLLHLYEMGLKVVLRHRFITLMSLFATIALTGYLFWVIPKGFFPQQDTGMIQGISQVGEDISFPAMAQRSQALVDVILQDPAVASIGSQIGASALTPTLNQGRMFIALKPQSQRNASADEVIRRLQPKLARIQGITLYLQSMQDITIGARVSTSQYQFTLTDANAGELNLWAGLYLDKIRSLPFATGVSSDQQNAGPLLDITIDRNVASTYGITAAAIDNALNNAFGQRIVSNIYTPQNQYHVVLEVLRKYQFGPEALNDIYVTSSIGQQVPLRTLVRTATKVAPIQINHQGQFPSVTISFNLKPGASIGQAVNAVHELDRQLGKPLSLAATFQGNAQAFTAALSSEPILIAAAVFVIYIILGVLYESAIHPITILSTLPAAGVGALLMLMAFGFDLTVIAIIGILLLIGIVKKNAIMLVDFAMQAEHQGMTPEQAIYQACILRFRPILMTTMAALLGAVPLMVGTGVGSEIRQPLGYAIVGGLLVSQLLTLYTTPVVYLYLDEFQEWLGKFKFGKRIGKQVSVPAE